MQEVLFDPGYSACVLGVSESAEFIYSAFASSYMPLKQKKFQFSILFPKLKGLINKNVSFYLGCLLWAVYIKNIEDGVLQNNPCFGEEYNEENSLEETSFLLDFIKEKLNRDTKYYLNKTYEPDKRLIEVLEAYAEFIKLNKGFVALKETKEIVLPPSVKIPDKDGLVSVKAKIDEAIRAKDLTLLFDVYDLILG